MVTEASFDNPKLMGNPGTRFGDRCHFAHSVPQGDIGIANGAMKQHGFLLV